LPSRWKAPNTTGDAARDIVSSSIAREIASSVRLVRSCELTGCSPPESAPNSDGRSVPMSEPRTRSTAAGTDSPRSRRASTRRSASTSSSL
jgi:hypothetical protein